MHRHKTAAWYCNNKNP